MDWIVLPLYADVQSLVILSLDLSHIDGEHLIAGPVFSSTNEYWKEVDLYNCPGILIVRSSAGSNRSMLGDTLSHLSLTVSQTHIAFFA